MNVKKIDVVIIGSGLASLMTAERLCASKNVMIVTKSSLSDSNSSLAQGGIAAAVKKEDHWQKHFNDTMVAGSFHNDVKATEELTKLGPVLIEKLIQFGVCFDTNEKNELSLGMEGAHSRRRILHVGGDSTGKAIVQTLLSRIISKVDICEEDMAYDLIIENNTCIGVYTKDRDGNVTSIFASHVVLATGGAGQLYSWTSNCKEATGDGVAMAHRAGAAIADMEFIQFHPTLLANDCKALGLVSEAVRGEGAKLITSDGVPLMTGKHPLGDLAPRDVVAREIYQAFINRKNVYLDITPIPNFSSRFPTIYKLCTENNISIEKGLLPVKPGAHFMMGGIVVDEVGQTTIPHLFAVGECAYTGVHGANRLASNSLLEAVVFADKMSSYLLEKETIVNIPIVKEMKLEKVCHTFILPTKQEIQAIMDSCAGITRVKSDLSKAVEWFNRYKEVMAQINQFHLSKEQQEICNMLTVGSMIVKSALKRNESRGGHFRMDYPNRNDEDWLGVRHVLLSNQLIKEYFRSETVNKGRHIS